MNTQSISFPVYIIYSRLSLQQLDKFFERFGDVGFMRIMYDKTGAETNRTIALVNEGCYNALKAKGYALCQFDEKVIKDDVKITKFVMSPQMVQSDKTVRKLYIPVPTQLNDDESFVNDSIEDKLLHLVAWSIIPLHCWKITIPVKSREKGGVKGGCQISFDKDVELERIAMVRLLMTDTYWPNRNTDNEERPVFKCYWHRGRKPQPHDQNKISKRIMTNTNRNSDNKNHYDLQINNDFQKQPTKTNINIGDPLPNLARLDSD